jgi:hypothetical protein
MENSDAEQGFGLDDSIDSIETMKTVGQKEIEEVQEAENMQGTNQDEEVAKVERQSQEKELKEKERKQKQETKAEIQKQKELKEKERKQKEEESKAEIQAEIDREDARKYREMMMERERNKDVFGNPDTPFGKNVTKRRQKTGEMMMEQYHKNVVEDERRRSSMYGVEDEGRRRSSTRDPETPLHQFTTPKTRRKVDTKVTWSDESSDGEPERRPEKGAKIPPIVPYVRIPDLAEFYMERKPLESLVKEELKQKGLSEDLKAQWAIEQFRNAADHLGVLAFIEENGKEIPRIATINEYLGAFVRKSSAMTRAIDEVIQEKGSLIKVWERSYYDMERGEELEDKYKTMANILSNIKKEKMELMDLEQRKEKSFDKNLQSAARQRDEDEGAMIRLRGAFDHLKKFMGDLMKKVPSIETHVRWKGTDGYNMDPYEAGDMKRVLKNLNFHYRSTNGIGKIALLIAGLRDHQGTKTAAQHLLAKEEWLRTLETVGITHIEVSELVALATIALFNDEHRDAFIQSETQLNQTMASMDGQGGVKQKPMLVRVQGFVHNLEQREVLGTRLRQSKGEGREANDNAKVRREETIRLRKEAVDVMAVGESTHSCPNVTKFGKCFYGDKCKYLNVKGHGEASGRDRSCHLWKAGNCRFGDKCKFVHDKEQPRGKQTSEVKKTGAVNFAMVKSSWGGARGADDESDSDFCVMEGPAVANSVVEIKKNVVLGWDSMASVHVAKELEMLDNPVRVEGKKVNGLGGERDVTHEGMCNAFNLRMKYIRDGGTPNLMSLAKVLGDDDRGLKGIAIFTDTGAIRFRAYPQVVAEVQKIVDALVEANLVEGYAEMRNGVYQQTFGGAPESGDDKAYAVTSMYASRVPLSSGEEVIGMLVSAGVTEESLVKGVNEGSIKGLPRGINETEVRRFFQRVGKDVEHIKGEIIWTMIERKRQNLEKFWSLMLLTRLSLG